MGERIKGYVNTGEASPEASLGSGTQKHKKPKKPKVHQKVTEGTMVITFHGPLSAPGSHFGPNYGGERDDE